MNQEVPRPEKIRFRRDEIADLRTLPSANAVPPLGRAKFRRSARLLSRFLFGIGLLFVLVVAGIYAIGATGVGSERLRQAAERAIEGMAGVDVNVAVGPASITLDKASFLALQVREVKLTANDGRPMVEAGLMRFGVRLAPLLSGEVQLTSARISDARIFADAMPSQGNSEWTATLRNADGLIDPDKVVDAVFGAVHQSLDAIRLDSIRLIDLDNVAVVLSKTGDMQLVTIADATVEQSGSSGVKFSSKLDIDGRNLTVNASAGRDAAARKVTALRADITVDPINADSKSVGQASGNVGAVALHLEGAEGEGGVQPRLSLSGSLAGAVLDLGTRGMLPVDAKVKATLVRGSNKIGIDGLDLQVGRSDFDIEGSLGPKPRQGTAGDEPSYRFDLVSNKSMLAPVDSSEPALNFIGRIAGEYQTVSRKLVVPTIAVRSGASGEVLGNAAVEFVTGKAPGVSMALNVHDMPVSHVKQLWPWFSARGAREWVLENLFGGKVVEASLQYQVAPGRAGNGVPLDRNEVFGRFQLEGSRFDTAGQIPPIRDANGVVEFHGNDVDISLSSGTVYMPSGRLVAASNGTLTVKNANVPPVIGALNIDVAGNADAVAELASYEPINAMRHVGLKPDELSGTVTGNVKADIPLQKGIDTSKLGWLVSLDYEDLAISKPIDDQLVTDADGSVVVNPKSATVKADALLNNIPAEIALVEPLEVDGPPRSRQVTLTVDDKIRQTLMPGLSAMLSGTMKIELDKSDNANQDVVADLTNAKLSIPWAGWSKGPGVPATVSFTMEKSGSITRLKDFDLDGKTFEARGAVELSDGDLVSANLSHVQLNRGDDVAVSIKRSGKGYVVKVNGEALDARALVKQFTSDTDSATKGTGGDAISVTANVKALTGFNDEVVSNFILDYSGAGSKVNGLAVKAQARSGASIDVSNNTAGGRHTLDMKSADAGAVLRFLDIYKHMEGGAIAVALSGAADGPMRGTVDARNFQIVNEPKLDSIVSTTPAGDKRSLNQAVKADIDTSRVQFERGYAEIVKGNGYLKVANGVLRGPLIGTTFQGTLYDQNDNMDMTGTFMPAYGINRIFGELPLVGALLGNGRDRGLIGVTYRLKGSANKPDLQINPLSVIAPGIFRSIFEFR
ncbi:DUF3971 domain-containing protein [Mesorhizobium sp. 1M-11]|uniref:YhdP family protein n=1 Tax=Mesorhizobium sp. 1M-11 TaxID=1529006 RepID=UPI0006C755E6|nr:DUF3971 domain-containing protein [Mesorhizobium sp. 1M-11]